MQQNKKRDSTKTSSSGTLLTLILLISFFSGVFLSCIIFTHFHHRKRMTKSNVKSTMKKALKEFTSKQKPRTTPEFESVEGTRILVAITSYNFNQLPHLEEALSCYRDVCEAGAHVKVVIYTTMPYPVLLIDLLNSRLNCVNPNGSFSIEIKLKSPRLTFHLVDCHRELFYDNLEDYDLFIYTEDDIRVTLTTITAYLHQTNKVINYVGEEESANYNVGIVRYEYNFPTDIIIDDKTRHATQNVTRVYWEHCKRPLRPNAFKRLNGQPLLIKQNYVTMVNYHQGMFFATQYLLKKWRERPNCNFDKIRNRPALALNPKIPTEGTQRVWMSSQMLYGRDHCKVLQLIPHATFEAHTILHIPNKNYRRLGKHNRIGGEKKFSFYKGADGKTYAKLKGTNTTSDNTVEANKEALSLIHSDAKKHRKPKENITQFQFLSPMLISELEFHIALFHQRKHVQSDNKYHGVVTMTNEIPAYQGTKQINVELFKKLVNKSMRLYRAYVARGGLLSIKDDISFLHLMDYYSHVMMDPLKR